MRLFITLTYIKRLKNDINSEFLTYFFRSPIGRGLIISNAGTVAITNIGQDALKLLDIPLPPLPEQQKIAEILSTIDEEIEKTDQIITQTEELKKGLMQELFTKGIGHARFKQTKIGEVPESWEVKSLKELSLLIKDGTHGTHKDANEGVFLLSAKDINNGCIDIQDKPRIISLDEYEKIHKNWEIKTGDILLTIVGTVGRVALVENYDKSYTFQRSVAILRLNAKECLNTFYKLLFQSKYFQDELRKRINASAQGGIYLGELSSIQITVPPIPEQQKIAEILSEVDNKIESERKYKTELEELKKGLIQDLLTGKKRVKV